MSGWNVCLSATIPCRLEMVGCLTNKVLQSRLWTKDEACGIRTNCLGNNFWFEIEISHITKSICCPKLFPIKLDPLYLVFGQVHIIIFMVYTFKKVASTFCWSLLKFPHVLGFPQAHCNDGAPTSSALFASNKIAKTHNRGNNLMYVETPLRPQLLWSWKCTCQVCVPLCKYA